MSNRNHADQQSGLSDRVSAEQQPDGVTSKNGGVRLAGVVAGMGSGLTKTAVGHGFDTVKTRLQCSPPGMYTGALDCLMKTVRNESILALYKGASPPAIGWAMSDSILLGSLYNYRLWLSQRGSRWIVEPASNGKQSRLTVLGHGLAGLGADDLLAHWSRIRSSFSKAINLQLQRERAVADRQFKGPIDLMRQVLKARGLLGLYRGFGTTLYFRGCFFWMFGSVEAYMRAFSMLQGTRLEMSTGVATFIAGGLGAFAFWAFAIPMDNVKNRIMSTPLTSNKVTALHVAQTIYRTQGVRGFYAGLVPILLRAFPVNAAAYSVYEGIMRLLGAEKLVPNTNREVDLREPPVDLTPRQRGRANFKARQLREHLRAENHRAQDMRWVLGARGGGKQEKPKGMARKDARLYEDAVKRGLDVNAELNGNISASTEMPRTGAEAAAGPSTDGLEVNIMDLMRPGRASKARGEPVRRPTQEVFDASEFGGYIDDQIPVEVLMGLFAARENVAECAEEEEGEDVEDWELAEGSLISFDLVSENAALGQCILALVGETVTRFPAAPARARESIPRRSNLKLEERSRRVDRHVLAGPFPSHIDFINAAHSDKTTTSSDFSTHSRAPVAESTIAPPIDKTFAADTGAAPKALPKSKTLYPRQPSSSPIMPPVCKSSPSSSNNALGGNGKASTTNTTSTTNGRKSTSPTSSPSQNNVQGSGSATLNGASAAAQAGPYSKEPIKEPSPDAIFRSQPGADEWSFGISPSGNARYSTNGGESGVFIEFLKKEDQW
ncbi:hypothetical protein FRB99_004173 [Tulasnella sp. 403]|nr:hypothetical protein FRB99_004173 [Tulasnella sp. 403]